MREEIEARPSAILFIGLVLGLIAFSYPLACLGFLAVGVWMRGAFRRWLLSGAFLVGLVLHPVPVARLESNVVVHGLASVETVPQLAADSQSCEVTVGGRRLVASFPLEPGVMLGDRIRVSGIARPRQFEFSFDLDQGTLRSTRPVEVVQRGSWAAHLADKWRRSFLAFVGRCLTPDDASLVDAICFNGRRLLPDETRQQMASSGLVHIMSASGLQVFVFGLLVGMVLRFLPITRPVQIGVLGLVLGLYALGSGLQPPIVRAVVMTLLGMSAYLVRREPDSLSALFVSGAGYLLWRPESVFGMGFQMSFLVVAAVALFYQRRRIGQEHEIVRATKEFLYLSMVVLFAAMPLVVFYFGVFSPFALLANLAVCWCLPLIVGLAFVAHGVWFVIPSVGESMAAHALSPLCDWVHSVLVTMGTGWGAIAAPDFHPAWLWVYYGSWLMTYRRRVVQP